MRGDRRSRQNAEPGASSMLEMVAVAADGGSLPRVEIAERYAAAVGAKDAEALLALYADDAQVFDMWGVWSYDAAGWRRNVEEWFRSLGDEGVKAELHEVRTRGGDRLTSVEALVTYRGLSGTGEELRAMTNRLTWVLERRGEEWLIVHEHTSSPIDFETGKPILGR
jgi:uncharacterized protein (TIGR02246 family)